MDLPTFVRLRHQRRHDPSPSWLVTGLHRMGLRDWHLQLASGISIFGCTVLWIRAKTIDQTGRGHAERRALFVGLWPPTFYLIGSSLEQVGTRSK